MVGQSLADLRPAATICGYNGCSRRGRAIPAMNVPNYSPLLLQFWCSWPGFLMLSCCTGLVESLLTLQLVDGLMEACGPLEYKYHLKQVK